MSLNFGSKGGIIQMSDNLVKIVRVDGMLLIGSLAMGELSQPRVIEFVRMQDDNTGIRFGLLPGGADAITLVTEAFCYAPADDALVNIYREAVTGLTIAKSLPGNVIKTGRH
jgi:hypothetical protein